MLRALLRLYRRLRFHLQGHRFDPSPGVMGQWPRIRNDGSLTFGPRVVFRAFRTRVHLTVARGATLAIGDDVFINDGVNIYAGSSVQIGAHTKIGDGVMIYDTDFHPVSPDQPTALAPVSIGRNVWIGAHAMVLCGAQIGDHAVIGAGAIVRGDVPARAVVTGSPARIVRRFECDDDWVRP